MVIWRGKRYIHSEDGVVSVEFSKGELELLAMVLDSFEHLCSEQCNEVTEVGDFMQDMTWVHETLEELEEENKDNE